MRHVKKVSKWPYKYGNFHIKSSIRDMQVMLVRYTESI